MAKLEEQLQIQYKFIQNRMQTAINTVIPLSFACAKPIRRPPLTLRILPHPPAPDIPSVCSDEPGNCK